MNLARLPAEPLHPPRICFFQIKICMCLEGLRLEMFYFDTCLILLMSDNVVPGIM